MNTSASILQFIKFGIVGLSNTALSYVVFTILVLLGTHYLIANAISFAAGVSNAFYWSNKYVFKKGVNEKRGLLQSLLKTFMAYGFTGLILNSLMLYLFVEKYNISSLIAQALCLLITVPLNYILNKYWSFKTKEIRDEEN
jgi:putative flippase GtrA